MSTVSTLHLRISQASISSVHNHGIRRPHLPQSDHWTARIDSKLKLNTSMIPKCSRSERFRSRVPLQHRRHAAPVTQMSLSTPDPVQGLLEPVCKFFRKIISPNETKDHTGTKGMEMVDDTEPFKWSGRTVFVAGGTGRTGQTIVRELLAKGDKVVALVSGEKRIQEILVDEMREHGPDGSQLLVPVEGNIEDEDALQRGLEACDAVVCAVGTRFVPGVGYVAPPEDLYGKGVPKLVQLAASVLGEKSSSREELPLFSFVQPADGSAETKGTATTTVDGWMQQDDAIRAGISESSFSLTSEGAVFEGTVKTEGRGFCAARAEIPGGPLNLVPYDGITMMVRGDGQRYKMCLKNQMDKADFNYQASFDTVRGEWVSVDIPFNRFRPGARGSIQADALPLQENAIGAISLVMSKFEYAGMPNYLFDPEKFKLEVKWIQAYRNPRPQFVLISSAGVERSARAKTPEEREKSLPIVKLNPGGILTWKLIAEDVLRASGLKYTIIRPCGLNDEKEATPCLLEVGQGDALSGLIPRKEVARVCVEALDSPNAANTTFEVRRDSLAEGLLQQDYQELFERLRPDVCPRPVIYVQANAQTPEEAPAAGESVSLNEEDKTPVQAL